MGKRLGRAAETHLPADVVPALQAQSAFAAGLPNLQGNVVADLERGHAGADSGDGAGGFMAQSDGLSDQDIAVAVVVEVVEVRAAEAGGLHGYLDLVGGERGQLTLLLAGRLEAVPDDQNDMTYNPKVLGSVKYGGFHCEACHA